MEGVIVRCEAKTRERTSVLFLWYYVPEEGEDEEVKKALIEKSLQMSDQVQDEDAWISESVQQGYDVGRYMPTVEQAAYHFHQQLYAQLAKE